MLSEITFITGNQEKATYLARLLELPVTHKKIELDELQSLDLHEIVRHKVRQAYIMTGQPVLVEDASLEFSAMGKLPGTFVKFFIDQLNFESICRLVDGKDRSATAKCVFGYYDGATMKLFEGQLKGTVAPVPKGQNGFGWDQIFIPDGYDITRAEMTDADVDKTYMMIKPIAQVKQFLSTHTAPRG